jgi:hypothetical protein
MYYQHLFDVCYYSVTRRYLTILMKEVTIANSCVQSKGCVAPTSHNAMYAINQTVGKCSLSGQKYLHKQPNETLKVAHGSVSTWSLKFGPGYQTHPWCIAFLFPGPCYIQFLFPEITQIATHQLIERLPVSWVPHDLCIYLIMYIVFF